MGEAYSDGRGVLQSYAEAKKWYTKAAAQGNKDAVHNLRRMRREEYLDHRAKVIADRREAQEEQQRAAQEAAQAAAAQQAAAARRQANAQNSAPASPDQSQPASVIQPTAPTPVLQSWVGLPNTQSVVNSGKSLTPAQQMQANMAAQFAASKGH